MKITWKDDGMESFERAPVCGVPGGMPIARVTYDGTRMRWVGSVIINGARWSSESIGDAEHAKALCSLLLAHIPAQVGYILGA